MKRNTSGSLKTWAHIDGKEHDVLAYWENSPPELDVNWAGGLVIDCVMVDDEYVTDELSDSEMADLVSRVEIELGEADEDDGLGDHLYDLKKDREL